MITHHVQEDNVTFVTYVNILIYNISSWKCQVNFVSYATILWHFFPVHTLKFIHSLAAIPICSLQFFYFAQNKSTTMTML